MRQCYVMHANATLSTTANSSSGRQYTYTKVLNGRKQPIRGPWRRHGRFYARLAVGDQVGRKSTRWIPLEDVATAAQAAEELRKLQVERSENRLRRIGLAPKLADYLDLYSERLEHSGKKHDTLVTERSHLRRWRESLGRLRVHNIRPHQVTAQLHRTKASGRSARTCNLALVALRVVTIGADGDTKNREVRRIGSKLVRFCSRSRAKVYGVNSAVFGTCTRPEGG